MNLSETARLVLLALQVLWGLIVALQLSRELEWQFADTPEEDGNAILFGSPGFKTVATLALAAIFALSLAPAYAWGGNWGFAALAPAALAVLYQACCGKSRIWSCMWAVSFAELNATQVLLPPVESGWPPNWGAIWEALCAPQVTFASLAALAAYILTALFAHWAEKSSKKEA